jgi:rod shape-determining protein MreC
MRDIPRRSWLPLVLFVLGAILLVVGEAGYLSPLEQGAHYILDPFQRLFSGAAAAMGDTFQGVRELRDLRAEVETLREQVNALTAENVRLREHEAEVRQLKALENFISEYPITAFVGAEVVGREACETYPCGDVIGVDPNPYLHYITINVGSRQGVGVGMPVVSGGPGLIGRVAEVAPRTAKVQLLTDRESSVAAILQDSRVTGLIVGEQSLGLLRMAYIPQDKEIQVGDRVLTSGLGGLLPKGLVIGQVVEVEKMDYELFQEAAVRPALDLSQVEMVLVITGFQPIPIEQPEPPIELPPDN